MNDCEVKLAPLCQSGIYHSRILFKEREIMWLKQAPLQTAWLLAKELTSWTVSFCFFLNWSRGSAEGTGCCIIWFTLLASQNNEEEDRVAFLSLLLVMVLAALTVLKLGCCVCLSWHQPLLLTLGLHLFGGKLLKIWYGLLVKSELNFSFEIFTTSLEIKMGVLVGCLGTRTGTHWPSHRLGCEDVASLSSMELFFEYLVIFNNINISVFQAKIKSISRTTENYNELTFSFLISLWNDCLFRKFTCHPEGE